ncbi:MAG: histidine decarboxylase [Deltaproteobacteria bacterium]|nr:histidine decarboxylase [Deltaproteobacteria bacterium]
MSKSSEYRDIPVIDSKRVLDRTQFDLSVEGLSDAKRKKAMGNAIDYLKKQQETFLGYQVSQEVDYKELSDLLTVSINNVGDPFSAGNYTPNTKFFETAVLNYYADLWRAKSPHDPMDPESYWGYVLSMGSSEGNIFASWYARDYLSGKKLIVNEDEEKILKEIGLETPKELTYAHPKKDSRNANAFTPIAFFSEDTHYSVVKMMLTLKIEIFSEIGRCKYPGECPLDEYDAWPNNVPSNDDGQIDIDALAILVDFFASKGYPIFIVANYGSTFKGAYDDVEQIGKRILPILKKYNLKDREIFYDDTDAFSSDVRTGYWIHVDAALGGSYIPFIEKAHNEGLTDAKAPIFDFRLPFVHSISTSGHKWPGAPWATGLIMTKVKYQVIPPSDPEYIGSGDTTFAGSRNGTSAAILWDFFAKNSHQDLMKKALRCEEVAAYTEKRLKELGKNIGQDLFVARSPLSLTIRFKRPSEAIIFKYSLSCETLCEHSKVKGYAHLFVMNHVSKELIDRLIDDLSIEGAFPEQSEEPCSKKIEKDICSGPALPVHNRGFE